MLSLRRYFATSDSALAKSARSVRNCIRNFSIPAPRFIFRPILIVFLCLRSIWFFSWRVFYAEPLFKAYCTSYGKNFHTDIRLHWVMGKGDIVVGDNVTLDGVCTFIFAARYCDRPRLEIGNNCHVSSGCVFVVAKSISIGNDCMIAGGVSIRDSDGHATEVEARRAGAPPPATAVQPIVIEDGVWIGAKASIAPGIRIGEGAIVSAGATVQTNVAALTIVAGNPARKVGVVPNASSAASNLVDVAASG